MCGVFHYYSLKSLSEMKKINFRFLLVFCMAVLFCTNSFSFTVKWTVSEGSWDEMYIHAWTLPDGPNYFDGWPGLKVTAVDGWYSHDFGNVEPIGIVLNNGGKGLQTSDIKPIDSDVCYELDLESSSYNQVTCPGAGLINLKGSAATDIRCNSQNNQIDINAAQGMRQVEIYNLLGARMMHVKNMGTSASINASRLNKGIYIVKVTLSDGSFYSQKICK